MQAPGKGNGGTGTITIPTGGGNKSYIVETKYNDNGSWYRKYSDGWVEQGGIVNVPQTKSITITVSFSKPFKSKNLYLTTWISNDPTEYSVYLSNYSSTSFQLWVGDQQGPPGSTTPVIVWYAFGMGAE